MNIVLIVYDSLQQKRAECCKARTVTYEGRRMFLIPKNISRKGEGPLVPGSELILENWATVKDLMNNHEHKTGLITDTYHGFKAGRNLHRGFNQFEFIQGQEDNAIISGEIFT